MGFLIRSAFWLSLVLLVIPFPGFGGDEQEAVSPIETFFAARAIIGDMSELCEREPAACEVGVNAFHTISVRAKESARIAYDILEEEPVAPEAALVAADMPATDALQTGTIAPTPVQAIPTPSPAPRD
jgi:hypothetical protein